MDSISTCTLSDKDVKIPLTVEDSRIFLRHELLQLSKLALFSLNGNASRLTQNAANVLYTNEHVIEFPLDYHSL